MYHWDYDSMPEIDASEEPLDSIEARENCLKLMLNNDSYLSEISFVEVLGKGVTGTVELCRHNTTGAFLADKITKIDFWNVTVSEAYCITRLSGNKYFVSAFAYFTSSAQYYNNHLIMEYFPGKNLRDFLTDRILNLKEVQNILRQLGEALLHMHSKGVIHLDIKPANILINDRLECKVIDFGNSVLGPKSTAKYGTKVFAAPEVLAHQRYVKAYPFGYPCDYYSLGLTALAIAPNLCHLDFLINLLGLKGQKPLATAVAVHDELNPDGPEDSFYDLISRLIEVDPDKRLDDKTFLSHPFFTKKFKNQRSSDTLTQEMVEHRIKKFQPKKYRKKISRSEITTEFQEKVMKCESAKAVMCLRFSSILDLICKKYDLPILTDTSKQEISLLSQLNCCPGR